VSSQYGRRDEACPVSTGGRGRGAAGAPDGTGGRRGGEWQREQTAGGGVGRGKSRVATPDAQHGLHENGLNENDANRNGCAVTSGAKLHGWAPQ
jgi:hypothetical protein